MVVRRLVPNNLRVAWDNLAAVQINTSISMVLKGVPRRPTPKKNMRGTVGHGTSSKRNRGEYGS